MMDNRQARQINEAARAFAEAVQESFRIASERSEEAQERANRLTRSFFESVASELQAETERNRAASQQLAEQSKKQQEAFRRMSEESMGLYRDFLGSVSAYYQANMEPGPAECSGRHPDGYPSQREDSLIGSGCHREDGHLGTGGRRGAPWGADRGLRRVERKRSRQQIRRALGSRASARERV